MWTPITSELSHSTGVKLIKLRNRLLNTKGNLQTPIFRVLLLKLHEFTCACGLLFVLSMSLPREEYPLDYYLRVQSTGRRSPIVQLVGYLYRASEFLDSILAGADSNICEDSLTSRARYLRCRNILSHTGRRSTYAESVPIR